MQTIKTMLVTALVCVAMPMSAQFSNSGSSTATENPSSYRIFSVAYDHNSVSVDDKVRLDDIDKDELSTNGVAIQFTQGSSLMSTTPLYLEWGIRASLGFKSVKYNENYYDYYENYYHDETYEYKITTLSLTVPVSVAYRYAVNESIAITPYTGLHVKSNILGKLKWDDGDESFNFFDKDDMDELVWERIQFGWQIGARTSFNSFNVGLEYGLDFNELFKKSKTSNFMVSVGFNF